MRTSALLAACSIALASCAAPLAEGGAPQVAAAPTSADPADGPVSKAVPPRILDETRATMLRENTGVTLQWIDWDQRGEARITVGQDGVWRLSAAQTAEAGDHAGSMSLEGAITEIGSDYFLFDGQITIFDTPDAGRYCAANKVWRFGITQGRQYWRLREFEWCDGLTDYIDIYF